MSKPKELKFEIINRPDPLYRSLDDLVEKHHAHLAEAKIALAWKIDWQPNTDGQVTLGMCKKASDLDRLFHDFDFIILLNREYWPSFTAGQQLAILDHELSHADVKRGDDGEVQRDDQDRTVYRCRKHDLEEFRDVVTRHGLYRTDLEDFARAIEQAKKTPLFGPVAGQVG
jgi:hypothetical protein